MNMVGAAKKMKRKQRLNAGPESASWASLFTFFSFIFGEPRPSPIGPGENSICENSVPNKYELCVAIIINTAGVQFGGLCDAYHTIFIGC